MRELKSHPFSKEGDRSHASSQTYAPSPSRLRTFSWAQALPETAHFIPAATSEPNVKTKLNMQVKRKTYEPMFPILDLKQSFRHEERLQPENYWQVTFVPAW